jgi:cell division protease FtsH
VNDGENANEEFRQEFRRLINQLMRDEPTTRASLIARLRDHLGIEPIDAPVLMTNFAGHDHANVHLALTAWFSTPGRGYELIGVGGSHRGDNALSELLEAAERWNQFGVGAVDYSHVAISVDKELDCVAYGFFLGTDGDERFAVLMQGPAPRYGLEGVKVEVIASTKDAAKRLLDDLPDLMREHNIFRGKVVSLEGSDFAEGVGPFRFHRRPGVRRSDVVLPDGVLERIERHVVGVADHREKLLAEGQHLRRGLLLYGPPGTGKTHTVRYLLSRLEHFTVVLLAGTTIQYISAACSLARMLQPALVVLEDCDLVAEARDFRRGGENPLLFTVLNEIDGLASEADVAFLMTTNRADLLEPALSQRPGRVDIAVEIPLPDKDGRRRLLDLYGPKLRLAEEDLAEVVDRTEGTTASFAKELVRRSVLVSAERGGDETSTADVRLALDELLSDRDALTRRLLGAGGGEGPDEPPPFGSGPPGPGIAPAPAG